VLRRQRVATLAASMAGEPRLSVVIVTAGERPERLAAALRAVAAQTLPAGTLEAIVVGNFGVPAPPAPPGLRFRFLSAPPGPQGVTRNRNLGWRHARAPIVAFTDDDCRPSARWAAELLAASERSPGAFIQGRTEPDPDEI